MPWSDDWHHERLDANGAKQRADKAYRQAQGTWRGGMVVGAGWLVSAAVGWGNDFMDEGAWPVLFGLVWLVSWVRSYHEAFFWRGVHHRLSALPAPVRLPESLKREP